MPDQNAASQLLLDAEGRYLQGPPKEKIQMLIVAGAKRPRAPRAFPIREGMQLVCIIDRGPFEAALWVQDTHDLGRCRDSFNQTPELVTWFEIGNEPLFYADRMLADERVITGTNGYVPTTKTFV